jgi:hypothetical protein
MIWFTKESGVVTDQGKNKEGVIGFSGKATGEKD